MYFKFPNFLLLNILQRLVHFQIRNIGILRIFKFANINLPQNEGMGKEMVVVVVLVV